MCILISDVNAFVSYTVSNRYRRKSHINQQTYMAVPQIVNSYTLYACGFRPSVHLVMKIAFCYRKDTVFLFQTIEPVSYTHLDDLFSSVVHHIIGQQISTKAHKSIWAKLSTELGVISPNTILTCGRDRLQAFGTTWKKVDYILDFAQKVQSGQFDIEALNTMTDEEAIAALSSLKGIGVWTAEMILLFCLQRPNIFSYGDLAILRGVRMVYRHKELPKRCV